MRQILRWGIDKMGFTLLINKRIPVGTDYRKTIRGLFGKKSISIVFDVGANVGQFCIHCIEIFEDAKILSFEPVNETYERLQKRTARYSNIQCFNLAFGEIRAKTEIFLQPDSSTNSLAPGVNVKKNANQKSQVVDIDTIDSFCKKHFVSNIDLLKIDTEGFDLSVLKGAKEMLQERKVKFILVEVTFDGNNIQNSSYQIISEFLTNFHYKPLGFFNQTIHKRSTKMNYCDALFYLQPQDL